MNDFLTDNSCFYEMLSSIYKATGVLYPLEKNIRILFFDNVIGTFSEKTELKTFFELFGSVTADEMRKLKDFVSDFLNEKHVGNSVKKMCFTVQEKPKIFAQYVVELISNSQYDSFFVAVSKAESLSDTITLMLKKNAVTIKLSDIIYVDYGNHSVEVHCTSGNESFFSVSFSDVAEKLLKNQNFLRSYKNCIVNMDRVECARDDSFIMDNGVRISIPKRRLRQILKEYNDYRIIK